MRKIAPCGLLIFLCTIQSIPVHAKMYTDADKTCIVNTEGRNTFWFCGKHSESCAGRKMRKRHYRHWMEHGHMAIYAGQISYGFTDDYLYFCCIKEDGTGYFKPQPKWIYNKELQDYEFNDKEFSDYNTTEIVRHDVNGGTCTYSRTVDMCGRPIDDKPCTMPDNCSDGTFLRNNSCTKPCDAGNAFESATSNNCIACETNQSQGISTDGICTKCNFPNEIFDSKKQQCEPTVNISKTAMKSCFKCVNNQYFKTCAQLFSMSESERTEHSSWELIKTNCGIE